MLLELYVADTVDKRLPVSSLGYASGVSIPTATRQTIEMESCKFVVRERDPHDGRRTNIALTARGRAILRCIRSEEHTSELQSLMRCSYAVFCLKKKKQNNNNKTTEDYKDNLNINRNTYCITYHTEVSTQTKY